MTFPLPGDVIVLGEHAAERVTSARAGMRLVIDSAYFGADFEDGRGPICMAICPMTGEGFRGTALGRDDFDPDDPRIYVSVSGGPCPFVPLAELELAGSCEQRFWRWRDFPRKDGGISYTHRVREWRWS